MRRGRVSARPFSFEPGPWEAFYSTPLVRRTPRVVQRALFGADASAGVDAVNAAIERFSLRHILGAASVDRVVALALDARHTDAGRALPMARVSGAAGTHMYASNTYVRDLCARHPERLWFGASVHPYRDDALAALDEVAGAGAVLIKWLPVVHNIDAGDPRTVRFLAHAGRIGMPILVHYGGEFSLPNAGGRLEDPRPMLEVLERLRREGAMPPVIMAHAATPSLKPAGRSAHFEALVAAMAGAFRDAPLYADLAGLATPVRAFWLKRMLRRRGLRPLVEKLVWASDFPVPSMPWLFWRELGWRGVREAARCASWIERDYQLKRRLGLPDAVFTRAGELIASVGRSGGVGV
jgi:hypothetical protein